MANILAAQNGDWSSTSTWTGGIIPSAGDNVYSNNRTVTININITVAKISNKAENGATAGGKFTLKNNVTVNANIEAGTVTCVDVETGASAVINGNITAGTTNVARGLDNTSTGTITISGNVVGGSSGSTSSINFGEGIRNSSSGAIIVTGTVGAGSRDGYYGILNFSTGSVTLNGDLSGNNVSATRIPLVNYGGGTLTINGNCYGSVSSAVYSEDTSFGGTVIINGNCFGASGSSQTGRAVNNNSASDTYYIYGNCLGGTGSTNSQFAVLNNSSGTINIIGNCTGGYSTLGFSSNSKAGVSNNSNGTINIIGNVYGGPKSSATWSAANLSYGVNNVSNGIVNVTGDCYGSSSSAINNNANGTVNVTGNCYVTTTPLDSDSVSNGATSILNAGTGTINITGNVYGSDIVSHTTSVTVNNNGTGTITIVGICYAGLTCSAARNSSSGILDVKRAVGNVFGNPPTNGQVLASYGVHSTAQNSITYVEEIRFGSGGNTPINGIIYPKLNTGLKVIFRNQGNVSETTIVDPLSSVDYPLASNVRYGVNYAFGTLIGTCNVPLPQQVSYGTLVDNTSGIAILDASTLWNFNTSSIALSGIGGRLKNCATSEIVASQLAAFFP
jgi:hypothetical protein